MQQEAVVREALLECMHLIALSIHPSQLGADYIFHQRDELLTYIKVLIDRILLILIYRYVHYLDIDWLITCFESLYHCYKSSFSSKKLFGIDYWLIDSLER